MDDLAHHLAHRHPQLYQTSPFFAHAVNTLASLLPYMIDGLAVEAEQEEIRFNAAVQKAMTDPISPILPPSDEGTRET